MFLMAFLHKVWLFARERVVYRLVQLQQFRARSVAAKLSGHPLVFVTVAFNDARLIRLQLEALGKFVADDYRVVIVDNSVSKTAPAAISAACADFGAVYVRGPWNLFSLFQGSLSHSSTLDWIWRGALRHLRATTVVLLDHDLFPVAPIAHSELLRGRPLAGRQERRAGMWYLWPGLLALDLDWARDKDITFMPYRELDSGGSLWRKFYRLWPEDAITVYPRETVEIMPGTRTEDSAIEIIDGLWIHLVDGSGWLDGKGKFERIFGSSMDFDSVNWDAVTHHLGQLGVTIPQD